MISFKSEVYKPFKTMAEQAKRVMVVGLIAALMLPASLPMQAEEVHAEENAAAAIANENGYLDKLVFGDATSESAHQFKGDYTTAITGLFGEPARVSNPRVPAEGQGGDLTFTIKVDPYLRNYFTVKFSGDEGSNGNSVVNINGEQVGYVRHGDYEAINKGWTLRNRFYYNTIMLPLESTAGKEFVEITIKTLNVWGKIETNSRGYYNAYSHTQAFLNVDGETQGSKLKQDQTPDSILASDMTDAEKLALINTYTQGQTDKFNGYSDKIDAGAGGKLSIIRYQDELKYYATVLKQDWSPANTPELKKTAIERIFKTIDNHVKDYYGNTRLVLRGGHQGDWGGYYGALGEGLYIIENLIKDDSIYGEAAFNAFLDQPLVTGTVAGEFSLAGVDWNGGELTRREAWERTLKANFDFARARLSYIYNQVVYTYEGAWEAHEGLRLIGSPFYEGKERSHEILLEALGAKPFLGEEVLVGPNDEELDLYHSLFYHDGLAVFTDDFVQIVGKGLAKSKLDSEGKVVRRLPYGKHYTGITEAGLTRENTYVANYGEASNYLKSYFYKTLDHAGDEEINDEILKLALKTLHARGYVRYTDLDDNGKRIMRAEQVTDERNQGMPGFYAYAVRVASQMALQFAALEMSMVQNEQRYSGPEWDEYWLYAKEAVGYLQQQLADHQFFNNGFGNTGSMSAVDYLLEDAYQYVTADRAEYSRFGGVAAGVVHPQTDFDYYKPEEIAELGVNPDSYERFAWVDIDNMYVSLRDGDFRMFGSLFERNRGAVSNGRIRVMNDNYDHNVQIATNNIFQYEDYNMRSANVDVDFMSDQAGNVSGAPQALAGEIAPMAYQPGVGTVNRDNYEADNPYSGYTDLMTTRYGKYFILFNTTRDEYGNKRSFEVELPADYTGSEVLDLVTGANVPVVNGKVTITPKSAMVLKLTADMEVAPKPFHVDFANALAGNGYVGISWKTTSGGQSYTIKRSDTENGDYATIATGVTGNFYKDTTVENGKTYYYKVAAVNENGAGWDSWRAKVDLTTPVSGNADPVWRDDRIGTTAGKATIDGASIAIHAVNGTGLGVGDDNNIYNRDINDSLHFVNQVAAGNSVISAKVDSEAGEVSGLMMRDQLAANTRYIYFGADQDGNLVLQNRTRISFHQSSKEVASPLNAKLSGYTIAEYPYIKLARDHDSQYVYAFVSKDGADWNYVTKLLTLLPYAYYTGVAASDDAQFSEVAVTEIPQGSLSPFLVKVNDQVTLSWNKPKQASWFNVYRTTDEAASLTDPAFKPGTLEPVDSSAWQLALAGTRATTFQETNLRYGNVYYKLLPIHGDGSVQSFSATTSTAADSFEIVMQRAESLQAADYTNASFYLFHKELDRIKEAMVQPEADEETLINEIYTAYEWLVSFRANLQKVQVEPSMVRASEKFWRNDNISEEQNGWFIFDGILNNITHTRSAISWVDIDFGAGNEKVVDTFRYLPREGSSTLLNRANNTVFKGSNDGVNWTDLHKITGVTEFTWYSAVNPDTTPYRYIRIYDDHNGFVNFTEVEFLERGIDRTLLTYLLGEASAAMEAEIYTAESLQPVELAVPAATAIEGNVNATQEEIDAAATDLMNALEGLQFIPGMPIIDFLGNKTVNAEEQLTFTVQASNATGIIYGVEGLPEGATFNAETQTFDWTPGKEQSGVHAVTFIATSGELSSSKTIKITVKGQPSISPDTTVELTAKQLFTYQVPASDPTGDPLVYSVGELPTGAVFDTSSGVFTWTPGNVDYGSHPITFTVSNERYSVSQTVDLMVKLNVLPSEDYTKGSYYLYFKEAARVEAEIVKQGADKVQLAAELDEAERLLVHIPISLYAFEGNTNNSFGASHGIAEGAPDYVEGKTGQAISLNGTDSYVSLPSSHALSVSDAITVAGWVNWKGGNQWQRIFDFGNDRNQYLFLTPRSGNNTLRFAIKNGGGEQKIETSQLPANQWVHVAVTLGDGTAKLYVNGEQKATASNFTIKPSDFKPEVNYIGKSQWPDPLYNGMIDEFRVYNYVLGAEEIQSAMNNTATQWIDNTLLPVLLAEASAINADHYTEVSVAVLQAAVSEVELLFANTDATQAEIDAVAAKLQEAMEGLEIKITVLLEPSAPNGLNGWYTVPVAVSLSAVGAIQYSLDDGTNWTVYDAPVTLNQEGANKLLYRPVKNGEPRLIEVMIDITAPQVNILGETTYTIDQMVTLTCSVTDVTSGVYGAPCDEPLLEVQAHTLESGQNSVTVIAEDMAGLQTTVTHTFTVTATFDSLKTVTTDFLLETGANGVNGIENALNAKLDNAKAAADRGDTAAVKDIMDSYIAQVNDLSGNKLTTEQAIILIRWAETIY